MHDHLNGDGSPNHQQDMADQSLVLIHVMALHPTSLTIPDLVRELTANSGKYAEKDNMERAIRDLTGAGLLHCPGGVVMPTQAAVRFHQILSG